MDPVADTKDIAAVTQRSSAGKMGMLKDVSRITKSHRCWDSHKNRIRRILECFSCSVLLALVSVGYASAGESVACPIGSPAIGIFSAEKIYKDSIIAIEKNDDGHAINLSLYRPEGNGCRKKTFAKYSIEGGDPNVDSIFFVSLNGTPNIFTIVHWDVNSRGIGTYGKYYQIYAYFTDNQGGLTENEEVVNDSAMSGMNGYQEGKQASFPYKNAGAVKAFFNCKGGVCKWH